MNDANGIIRMLVEKFNFSLSDIQMLFEETATRKNILDGLDNLIKEIKPEDVGVFAFFGHGVQIPEIHPTDEGDLLDEAIVPFDAVDDSRVFPDNFIRDHEIHALLSNLQQNLNFTFIFDSCFSGTITRVVLETLIKTRALPPSVSVTEAKKLLSDLKISSRSLPTNHSFSGENYYLLAACRQDQEAKDDGEHGYFTGELLRNIYPGITYEQLKEKVVPVVKERSSNEQEPQFEGPDFSIPIFGITSDSRLSMSSTNKIFGMDISPDDISLGSNGSIVIRNPKITDLVKQSQQKLIKEF